MDTIFLDVETTGLNHSRDKIVDIGIVDEDGNVLLNTLVNPEIPIPFGASRIHGIRDDDVVCAPSYDEIKQTVKKLCDGRHVVAYNASFDMGFLQDVEPAKISCAMLAYSEFYGQRSDYHGGYKWQKLSTATTNMRYDWGDDLEHRALSDAKACRYVWIELHKLLELRKQRVVVGQPTLEDIPF